MKVIDETAGKAGSMSDIMLAIDSAKQDFIAALLSLERKDI